MIKHLCKLVWNRKRVNFLITLEIFFSFLVVFGVIVLAVYFTDNYRYPLGFNYENVWNITVGIQRKSDNSDQQELLDRAKEVLTALHDFSGIESAAIVWGSPYSRGMWTSANTVRGKNIKFQINSMTDDAREVFKLNLVRGRWFSKEDDGGDYKPIVINKKLAEEYYGSDDPIGKDPHDLYDRVDEGPDHNEQPDKRERIVGVIDDFRMRGEFEPPANFLINRNNLRLSDGEIPRNIVVRVHPGTTAEFEEPLIRKIQAIARDWSFEIKTIDQMRQDNHQSYLVPMAAFGLVAGFLLLMVALGLSGVLWQNVTQRIKEIGLRRAKGATRRRIYQQILGELLVITSAGLLLGVLVVIQFPLLDLLGLTTPRVYAISTVISMALIYLLSVLCGLYPSRLATRVQPAEALHYE
jgi:putative ABC transport system permease protein